MRQFSAREVEKIMKDNGYRLIRHGNGSHTIWYNGKDTISLPKTRTIHSVIMLRLIKEHSLKVSNM